MNEIFKSLDNRINDIQRMNLSDRKIGGKDLKKNEKVRILQESEYINLFFQLTKVGVIEVGQFQSKATEIIGQLIPEFKFRFVPNDLIQNLRTFADLFVHLGNTVKQQQILNMIDLHRKSCSRLFLMMIQSLQEITRIFFNNKLKERQTPVLVAPLPRPIYVKDRFNSKFNLDNSLESLCLSLERCSIHYIINSNKINAHKQIKQFRNYRYLLADFNQSKLEASELSGIQQLKMKCEVETSQTPQNILQVLRVQSFQTPKKLKPLKIVDIISQQQSPFYLNRPRSHSLLNQPIIKFNMTYDKTKQGPRKHIQIYCEVMDDFAYFEGRYLTQALLLKFLLQKNQIIQENILKYIAKTWTHNK